MSSADFELSEVTSAREFLSELDKYPDVIDSLDDDEQHAGAVDILAARQLVYKYDINRWLKECVKTVDEASGEIIPWPTDKAYLAEFFKVISESSMVAVPKSRRMMISWAMAAYCLHRARYWENQAVFIQSETEGKSAYILDKRCVFMEENQPRGIRRVYKTIRTADGSVGRMTFRDTGSYIWAIAQGGDVLRAYTPSLLFLDEVEYMAEGHQSLTAALPMVEKGCKLVLVSSSNGPSGVLAGICKDVGIRSWADVQ